MPNRLITITTSAAVALPVLLMAGTQSSNQLPPPEDTEIWEPEPKVVGSGTQSAIPTDATVLFDGNDLSKWKGKNGTAEWTVANGAFTVKPGAGDISTIESFGDFQLHVEWRTPTVIVGERRGRGNSGHFFMERSEVQVLL